MKILFLSAIVFLLISCEAPQVMLQSSEWKLVKIGDQDVSAMNPAVTLSFDDTQKKINGFGGCNRFFGSYQLTNPSSMAVSNIGATKMYCNETMDVETRYFQALNDVQSFKVESSRLLLLRGETVLLEFKK